MNSRLILAADVAKKLILDNISTGKYKNRFELNSHIKALGLTQTRNGSNYVGLMAGDGKRFRIHLEDPLLKESGSPTHGVVTERNVSIHALREPASPFEATEENVIDFSFSTHPSQDFLRKALIEYRSGNASG